MARANIFHTEFEYDPEDPEGYRSGVARVGAAAGGKALTVKLYEAAPGQSICPYHYEYEEEWLLVLAGSVVLRTPAGEEELEPGALVCFPPGPEGAHAVSNPSRAPARLLMFSSSHEPAVAVYPDSDKIGVWPGRAQDNIMVRRTDANVDYYEGET